MKQTILIIEDEEDLLELLEYHLKKEGYETLKLFKHEKCGKMPPTRTHRPSHRRS